MIGDIKTQMQRTPFVPFSIRTSDGHEYPVHTLDHISISPRGTRVVVYDDTDSTAVLPILHISGIVHQTNGG